MNARRLWFSFAILLLAPALVGLAAEKDAYGDPLPDGAKSRLGTARLRVQTYSTPILTPDAKSLYAQSGGGLALLDPATGAVQKKVPAQFFGTPTILSADGKRAAYVSYDRVTVWDTESGKAVAKVERRLPSSDSAAALSANGKVLAIGGAGDRTKKDPITVLVWDVDADKEVTKVTAVQNDSASAAISADGKVLATWGVHFEPDSKTPPNPETNPGRFVHFWNAADGKELAKFRVAGYAPSAVVFSPDGSVAAIASNNSSIDLVDPKTGAGKQVLLGRSGMGRSITFSPDGATVAGVANDGTVQRWKVADGTRLSTTEPPSGNMYNVRLRMLDNEKAVAWGARGQAVVVWDVPSGKLISPAGGHTSMIRGLVVTPDNKHVITSSEDGATLKWELETGKPAGAVTLRSPYGGVGGYVPPGIFSPDVTRALIRDSGGSGLGVHDVATGTQQYVIPTPLEGSSYGIFAGNGSKVVVTSSSYNPKQTPGRVTVWDVASAKRASSLELPGYGTLSATITPDGKHIVTAGRKPAEKGNGEFIIAAWDAANGAKKGEFVEEAGYSVPHVAAAADNKTAVAVTSKGALVSFDLTTGKLGKTFDINRRTPALAPVFSPDGKKFAVGCTADYTANQVSAVLVIDWESGTVKQTFSSPGGTVTSLAFSPDGKWLVTASPDTTATVWELK